jgi:hypothetical protein
VSNVTKSNPVRIRSKICLLEYPKLRKDDIQILKDHIREVFKFKLNSDWEYVFKEERFLKNKSCLIVFIKCKKKPDVYSFNLNLSVRDIALEPRVWCFTEQELPMYIIMKLSNERPDNIHTNIQSATLQNHRRVIDYGITDVCTKPSPIEYKSAPSLKDLKQKQKDKIKEHMLAFDNLYENASSNLVKLKKLTTSMRNYRYSHKCPYELNTEISRYEKLYSTAAKKRKT